MGNALQAVEPNMGNNHFEGVSLQAGINFENTGKNEYILDSKYDNISANASIFTDANKTKAYEGNTNFTLKFDSLSYERDNNLQIGGELGVTYRQPMGEGGLLVGGYVGVAYNFDNEHSYNFKANGTGGGEQSALEFINSKGGDNKRVTGTPAADLVTTPLASGTALKFANGKTIVYSNIGVTYPASNKEVKLLNKISGEAKSGDNTDLTNVSVYAPNGSLIDPNFGDVDATRTSFKVSRDITVKVKNDFSFIVAGTVGMPVMDRLLLEGMIGLKIDTYKFNATGSDVAISDLANETASRKLKSLTSDDKAHVMSVAAKSAGAGTNGWQVGDAGSNLVATGNEGVKNVAAKDNYLDLNRVKSAEWDTSGTTTWNKGNELYAANAAESQKTEEKSKMCYKGYVGLRAIFNVKDNLDLGVKGYVAFPLKSEYELELSQKEGSKTALEAKFKPKMQFGGGLFISYSF